MKKSDLFFFLFLFPVTLFSEFLSEEEIAGRIDSHLILDDVRSAIFDGFEGLSIYPESEPIQRALIIALAKQDNHKELMDAWQQYACNFPEKSTDEKLLEAVCWGIVHRGSQSSQILDRLYALFAGVGSKNIYGVGLLDQSLCDRNAKIRAIAAKLSAHFRDDQIKDTLLKRLKEESVWYVRLEIIGALGKIRENRAEEPLKEIISNNESSAAQAEAAMKALVNIKDTIDSEELNYLTKSGLSRHRKLACHVVTHLQLKNSLESIYPLTQDTNFDVRKAALITIGIVGDRNETEEALARASLEDPHPQVACTASWLLALCTREKGLPHLQKWLHNPSPKIQRFAASALASCGLWAVPAMLKEFKQAQDPYVRMNLALGLIYVRAHTKEISEWLAKTLIENKERLMWQEVSGVFRILQPSNLKHTPQIPNFPEVKNQLTRLELYNLLAIVETPLASCAIQEFLKREEWGISGIAAALILENSDDQALKILRDLIEDENINPKIRIQAALALAIWGKDPSAAHVLENAYPHAERKLKEQILEGHAKISTKKSIPFLIKTLEDPHPTLQILAACALLKCVNS